MKYDKAMAELNPVPPDSNAAQLRAEQKKSELTCTQIRYKELDRNVGVRCKGPPLSCKKVAKGDCPELELRVSRNNACAWARRLLMDECFGGGNSDHKGYLADAEKLLDECRKRYGEECK